MRRPEELLRAREAAGDRIVIGLGSALAASAMALLVYAFQTSSTRPDLPTVLPPVTESIPVNRSLASARHRVVDPDPATTGSIRERADLAERARAMRVATAADQPEARTPARGYVVWRVHNGVALVEGPDGLREVAPGEMLPGAGQVLTIERSGSGWMVLTSETVISTPVL